MKSGKKLNLPPIPANSLHNRSPSANQSIDDQEKEKPKKFPSTQITKTRQRKMQLHWLPISQSHSPLIFSSLLFRLCSIVAPRYFRSTSVDSPLYLRSDSVSQPSDDHHISIECPPNRWRCDGDAMEMRWTFYGVTSEDQRRNNGLTTENPRM